MNVIALNAKCLSEADVLAFRRRILSLIRRGHACRWNLDMGMDGYESITVLGDRDDPLFAISKKEGAYRVVDDAGRPLLQTRLLANALAILP